MLRSILDYRDDRRARKHGLASSSATMRTDDIIETADLGSMCDEVCLAILGRAAEPGMMQHARSSGHLSPILKAMLESAEYRLKLHRLLPVPTLPPARLVLFDHLMKTGGTAVHSALCSLFPLHIVSPHIVTADQESASEIDSRWTIVAGHIGRQNHNRLADVGDRVKLTLVREPFAWVLSLYRYWRYAIPKGSVQYHSPPVALARELGFSDFIRTETMTQNVINYQSRFLGGAEDPGSVFSYYDVVGTTENMAQFIDRSFSVMGVETGIAPQAILASVPNNESSGPVKVTEDDKDFIHRTWQADAELYALATEGH